MVNSLKWQDAAVGKRLQTQEAVVVDEARITIFSLMKNVKKPMWIIINQRKNKSKMKRLTLTKKSC